MVLWTSVFYLITTNVKKIIFKNTKKESDLFKEKNQIIYDTFQGIREVILYNLKNFYFKRFDFILMN